MIPMLVVFVVVFIVLFWLLASYNGLVKAKNMAAEALSGVDVALRRRFDLVPNLVETVKGYASHEKDTLENVIKMRNQIASANGLDERFKAENALTGTLGKLFVLSESYPDLKANQNFLSLQTELGKIEDDLQLARRFYNGCVRNLNNACEVFPSVIVARMFGFKQMTYFETSEETKATPSVQF
ncbi:MAG: LemA family protein [Synergistaceae bacterium]|nr:LemA family protein [Synergistaceae bacterium]